MSILANSEANLELFQTTLPSVSSITKGNGALIKLVLAAESTVMLNTDTWYYHVCTFDSNID